MSLPPGWRIARVGATRSTNADLMAEAERGAAEGTALMADLQLAGRGREGRVWQSPAGNLHLSVVLRPDCPARDAGQVGLVAAVAIAGLLGRLGLRARLKWPNDVLVDGAKIAGVLVEAALAGDRVAWAVVGIGLNVLCHPDDAGYPATSLAAHQISPPTAAALAPELLSALAASLADWRAYGFARIRAAWLSYGPAPGEAARVSIGAAQLTGAFRDLDPDGALVLEVLPGQHRRITAGELAAP